MKQATHPTSQYNVSCDHFDTFGKVEIHQTDDGLKLKLSVESVDSDEPLSISLFKEDVEMMIAFMRATLPNLVERP